MTVDIATLAALVVIAGFLWGLHRDMAGLRERMARMEGKVEVMSGQLNMVMSTLIERERKDAHS